MLSCEKFDQVTLIQPKLNIRVLFIDVSALRRKFNHDCMTSVVSEKREQHTEHLLWMSAYTTVSCLTAVA